MTKSIFRICTILALSFAAWQTSLSAQDEHTIKGTWAVAVTVVNCQTGAPIRTVHSLQLFSRDGSFSETANTFLRGSSVGVWDQAADHTYKALYWFFRYNADGSFASTAQAIDSINMSDDGTTFTASGTIQDFNANNQPISIGCFTHAATRLSGPGLVP
jgi:hypothetical protein